MFPRTKAGFWYMPAWTWPWFIAIAPGSARAAVAAARAGILSAKSEAVMGIRLSR